MESHQINIEKREIMGSKMLYWVKSTDGLVLCSFRYYAELNRKQAKLHIPAGHNTNE